MVGGVNNPGGNAYSNGSQPLTLSNLGAITINLQGVESSGGSALYALTQGGNAEGGDPASGAGLWGGSAGSVILTNNGTISIGSTSAPLGVQQGYGGIEALALGGNGATDADGNTGSAGNSGNATVTSWAPVTVNLNWQNATSNSRAYGILAQSVGGNGALSPTDDSGGNGSNGGNGGFDFSQRSPSPRAPTSASWRPALPHRRRLPVVPRVPRGPSAGVAAAILAATEDRRNKATRPTAAMVDMSAKRRSRSRTRMSRPRGIRCPAS